MANPKNEPVHSEAYLQLISPNHENQTYIPSVEPTSSGKFTMVVPPSISVRRGIEDATMAVTANIVPAYTVIEPHIYYGQDEILDLYSGKKLIQC
jgi:hypothetical protein